MSKQESDCGGHARSLIRSGCNDATHTYMCVRTLLLALVGHPAPRRRRATPLTTELDDLARFRCPEGPFLDHQVRRDNSARLQQHIRRALSHGLVSSVLDATPRPLANVTPLYTHEAAAWPKPSRCRRRRAEVCSFSPHFCLSLPSGNAPRSSLISERHGLEFRQVWKVASSSLASFFFCNLWGDLALRKQLPSQPPPTEPAGHLLVAFASRDPISRFVASAHEATNRSSVSRRHTASASRPEEAVAT